MKIKHVLIQYCQLDGGVFSADPYKTEVINFATKKQVTAEWHMIFLRGIGCNWLVCLACFFGIQGRDLASKIIGIWWPIFAFVSLGFDHVVANMTFIPMAIFVGAPKITVGLYIWKGIIPTLIGNIIGGGLFVGKSFLVLTLCLANFLIRYRHVLLVHVPARQRPNHHLRSRLKKRSTNLQVQERSRGRRRSYRRRKYLSIDKTGLGYGYG